jgi:pimeloyl-ACP methyl ester carboxylesterase
VPSARIELLDGAGHALFVDQAERFNTLLEDLISMTAPRR